MTVRAAGSALLAFAAVAACGHLVAPAPAPTEFVCPGGVVMLATFHAQDSMRLEVDGRVYELPRLISASGARYGAGAVTFWNKGREALLQRPDGRSYTSCIAQQ